MPFVVWNIGGIKLHDDKNAKSLGKRDGIMKLKSVKSIKLLGTGKSNIYWTIISQEACCII